MIQEKHPERHEAQSPWWTQGRADDERRGVARPRTGSLAVCRRMRLNLKLGNQVNTDKTSLTVKDRGGLLLDGRPLK
jgi:hypothetical protein